jgi:hypothetical protein
MFIFQSFMKQIRMRKRKAISLLRYSDESSDDCEQDSDYMPSDTEMPLLNMSKRRKSARLESLKTKVRRSSNLPSENVRNDRNLPNQSFNGLPSLRTSSRPSKVPAKVCSRAD